MTVGAQMEGGDTRQHYPPDDAMLSSVPVVMVQGATPIPAQDHVMNDVINDYDVTECASMADEGREDDEEEDEEDEFDDEEMMGEEEEDGEEKPRDMTTEEKRDMYLAVRGGDLDQLEDCLDRPHSDINMLWFRENLLMTAIRDCNQEVCEFLLDNGVDHTYVTSVVGQRETSEKKRFDVYEIGCRQMAYDYQMYDIVHQIDRMQNKLFPFIRLPDRSPRYRRPKPSTPSGSDVESGSGGSGDFLCSKGSRSGSEITDSEGSVSDKSSPRRKRRKKRGKKKMASTADETKDSGCINKTAATEASTVIGSEVDSGHHSAVSSKLRIHMVREHDKLIEKEEQSLSTEDVRSVRRSTSHSSTVKAEDKIIKDQSDKSDSPGSKTNDDGYASISQKSSSISHTPEMKPVWASAEPLNRIRGTKSALSKRKCNFSNYFEHQNVPFGSEVIYNDEPLHWRKISTIGSYAKESKNWHVKNDKKATTDRVDITPICLSSPPPPSLVPKRSILRGSGSACSTSTTSSGKSFDRASSAMTDSSEVSIQSQSSVLASYMRPTRSTVTKQRLSPSFVKSYGGLEFTRVINSSHRPINNLTTAGRNTLNIMRSSVTALGNTKSNKIVQKRNNPFSFRK